MVVQDYNPSIWEPEAGESQIQAQSRKFSELTRLHLKIK